MYTHTDDAAECLSKLLEDLRMPLQGFFASGESELRDILRTRVSPLILTACALVRTGTGRNGW